MDIFNKEHFTKKQLEVAKDFEKARKQLNKYNLILNDNGGNPNCLQRKIGKKLMAIQIAYPL